MSPEIRIDDLILGVGDAAQRGSKVVFHCATYLNRGDKVRDTRDEGHGPMTTTLGKRQVVAGLEKGLNGMKAGGKRRVRVPPHLGYRELGVPNLIPPNAVLAFEVEMISVEPPRADRSKR